MYQGQIHQNMNRRAGKLIPSTAPRGFTLIELLVVIGIITILASIAAPNYLEAVTRSKVSKFMGDCKAIETGLETYNVDNSQYPPEDFYPVGSSNSSWESHVNYPASGFLSRRLTTPIAYLGKLPFDPFPNKNPNYRVSDYPARRTYNYSNDMDNMRLFPNSSNQYYVSWVLEFLRGEQNRNNYVRPNAAIWMITTSGPDGDRDHGASPIWTETASHPTSYVETFPVLYDPTNGTMGNGDLFMFGPGVGFPGH